MATPVSLSLIGNGQQFFTNGGLPLNGGKIYTFQAGTSTAIATYTEPTGTIANSNPIVLDSSGRPPQEIWLIDGFGYKFLITDSLGATIITLDNLSGAFNSLQAQNLLASQSVTVVGGTANVITLTPPITATTYYNGQTYYFSPTANNTAGVTVDVNSLGAKTLYSKGGTLLTGDELSMGGRYQIQYSSTLNGFVLINGDDGQAPLSFTPTVAFGGGTTGITYVTQTGRYLKIGGFVFVWIYVRLSSKGSSTGSLTIENIPYTISSTAMNNAMTVGAAQVANVTIPASNYLTASPILGTKTFGLTFSPTLNPVLDSDCTNTSRFSIAASYIAA